MDEPLSNLDAKLRVQMRAELKRFHVDLKATILYVTHDQLEAVTMADRIAVMNGGILQQYASPDEIFNHPVNTFVAGFVGSPAMNLLRGKVEVDGGSTSLVGEDGWRLPLTAARGAQARQSLGDVVIGVRHGQVKLHRTENPMAMPARVYTVEPTGDLTYVHINLGNSVLVASASSDFTARPDDPIWVEFDQDHIHLFDAETEQALPRIETGAQPLSVHEAVHA
jgi:multiple sugar transport system ATP-binding protein